MNKIFFFGNPKTIYFIVNCIQLQLHSLYILGRIQLIHFSTDVLLISYRILGRTRTSQVIVFLILYTDVRCIYSLFSVR